MFNFVLNKHLSLSLLLACLFYTNTISAQSKKELITELQLKIDSLSKVSYQKEKTFQERIAKAEAENKALKNEIDLLKKQQSNLRTRHTQDSTAIQTKLSSLTGQVNRNEASVNSFNDQIRNLNVRIISDSINTKASLADLSQEITEVKKQNTAPASTSKPSSVAQENSKPKKAEAPTPPVKKSGPQYDDLTANYVSRKLKSPGSAQLVEYSGPEEAKEMLRGAGFNLPDCTVVTRLVVDSQNGFGAMLRGFYFVFFENGAPCHMETIESLQSGAGYGNMSEMLKAALSINDCDCWK